MDARTFQPKNQIPLSLHINVLAGIYHTLGAAISYDPSQKWYYYSRQSTTEVLVFHQYSKVCHKTYGGKKNYIYCLFRENGSPTHTLLSSTEIAQKELKRTRGFLQSQGWHCSSDY